jgi:hypothetical protein
MFIVVLITSGTLALNKYHYEKNILRASEILRKLADVIDSQESQQIAPQVQSAPVRPTILLQ